MAIREIVIEGDDILTKVCRPVEKFDEKLGILLDDRRETMVDADGVGLAAPQIGILRRVVVIDIGEGLVELVNPEIIYEEGEQEMQEGCLSCPGVYGMTKRPAKVRVSAQNRNGERFEFEAKQEDNPDGELAYLINGVDVENLPKGIYRARGLHAVYLGDEYESFASRTDGIQIYR